MEHVIIIASISAVAAAGGLIFNAYERHRESKIARGTFWLELEKMFQHYDQLYLHLRFQGGDWVCKDDVGPSTKEDIAQLCDYIGLFEHCYILLKQNIIDLDTFQGIYKTRIIGLLSNKIIRKEISNEKWETFHELLRKLGLMTYGDIFSIDECREYVSHRTTKFK